MKTMWAIILITLIIILGAITGMYFYRINRLKSAPQEETIATSKVDDECTEISELASLRYTRFRRNKRK